MAAVTSVSLHAACLSHLTAFFLLHRLHSVQLNEMMVMNVNIGFWRMWL